MSQNYILFFKTNYFDFSGSFETLKPYIENSRNLTRVVGDTRRQKLLHRGRLPIVSFLSGLPKTDHDATTFTLDLPFASKTMMTFTVTGVFKERESKYSGIRHFNRY
jgi:nuclear RNA export factor